MEYMRWLPTFFPAILKVNTVSETQRIEIALTFFRKPLLSLQYVRGALAESRDKFHIVGGLLTKTSTTGWLEFRQVDHKKYTLAAIHEFIPRLPWMIYIWTQAPLHRFVMRAFGRHLKLTSEKGE
jgi:hypothetical protein